VSLEQVAPGVWVATAATWATTSTVVVADNGDCLVVDPALTVDEVAGLATEIASRGWRPVVGFSTHPHWDHVLWSAELGDVPRWATATAVRAAAVRRRQLLGEVSADAPGHDRRLIARLTPLLRDAGKIPWDGPRTLVVPYHAHCYGSAALVLPDVGVLVAGDVLSNREVPLIDLDSPDPIVSHRLALLRLEQAASRHEVSVLVPGHGTVTDRAGLEARLAADRAYLDSLETDTPSQDPRLADEWVAGEHERQVLWARGGRLAGS
jgi:hydroxyacylglutathione hydrolase